MYAYDKLLNSFIGPDQYACDYNYLYQCYLYSSRTYIYILQLSL